MLCTLFPALAVVLALPADPPGGGVPSPSQGGGRHDDPTFLPDLSLEELLEVEIEVTSAGRKPQEIRETAAAVFVLTAEDIRRSGATSLPEALRLVPGLQVSRVNSSTWAIGARGFADQFANKLLVLIDGRSVYTPLFSGVFWDVQDVMLEDVERIEIIRGPGAALWGANAVNGIVNVITKSAARTQGTLVALGAGSEERAFGAVRHGGMLDQDTAFRVYAKGFDRDGLEDPTGSGIDDDWWQGRAGFRVDWSATSRDELTVQADLYDGHADGPVMVALPVPPFGGIAPLDTDVSGFNVLTRWTRTLDDDDDLALQVYFDRTERSQALAAEDRDTFDADFQHRLQLDQRNELIWGLGFRHTRSELTGSFTVTWDPLDRKDDLFSAFAQDEYRPREDLALIGGVKLEHNDYTGAEVQPSARAVWSASQEHSLWAGISRAVRTPNQVDHDVRLVQGIAGGFPPVVQFIVGNEDFQSEELVAYELGHRWQPRAGLALDLALFFNDYDRLSTLEPGPIDPATMTQPIFFENRGEAETYGAEVSADWQARPDLRLGLAYTFLEMRFENPGSAEAGFDQQDGQDPEQQVSLYARHDLSERVELDGWLSWVDRLPTAGVDGYLRADLRLGWHLADDLELSLVAQGLLHDGEHEAPEPFFGGVNEVQAGFYAALRWGI